MTDPICRPCLSSPIHKFQASRLGLRLAGVILLMIGIHCEARDLAGKAQPPDKLKPCMFTDPDIDAGTHVNAVDEYKDVIAELLRREKFEEIDCIANSVRSGKKKFGGGIWKLHTLYSGLEKPRKHATEEDWTVHLGRLERWVIATPDSITAHVALAKSYISYAWYARGNGYSDTVSESGWKLFSQRMDTAKAILDEASTVKTKCPEWYLAMEQVAEGQGWEPEELNKLFAQAVAFEPSYYYFYRIKAELLLPKWGGKDGDAEKFAGESADSVGGAEGDMLYFQLAVTMLCDCDEEPQFGRMSWPRIQKGFAELEKKYGPSLEILNVFAKMAVKSGDSVLADSLFKRIGDNWHQETWDTLKYFTECKTWAATMAPIDLKNREIHDAAEANMRTPEGVQYMKVVNEKVNDMLRQCVQTAGGDLQPVEIMLQIGVDGVLVSGSMANNTAAAVCVFRQLGEAGAKKQPSFPPPPHPAYWIKLDLDPTAMNVALK